MAVCRLAVCRLALLGWMNLVQAWWTPVKPLGVFPAWRYGPSAVISNTSGIFIFGGDGGDGVTNNDLWYLDGAKITEDARAAELVRSAGPTPAARSGHSAVITAAGRMWIFGGKNSYGLRFNDLAYIDTAGQDRTWTAVTPTGTPPPARDLHTAVITATGRMWIFGGIGLYGKINDLWFIDTSEGQEATWTNVLKTGWWPFGRARHSAVLAATGQMWIFGGGKDVLRTSEGVPPAHEVKLLNDLWYLDTSEGQDGRWTEVTPTGALPPARADHSAVLTATGQMLVFGGGGDDGRALNDLWLIDTTQGTAGRWWQVRAPGPLPPARFLHSAILTPSGHMWTFGGGHCDTWSLNTSEVEDQVEKQLRQQLRQLRDLELVGQLLPAIMGSWIFAALFFFGYWIRWEPAVPGDANHGPSPPSQYPQTGGDGPKTKIGKGLMDTE